MHKISAEVTRRRHAHDGGVRRLLREDAVRQAVRDGLHWYWCYISGLYFSRRRREEPERGGREAGPASEGAGRNFRRQDDEALEGTGVLCAIAPQYCGGRDVHGVLRGLLGRERRLGASCGGCVVLVRRHGLCGNQNFTARSS